MNLNEIPWTADELVDYGTLVAATLMVAAFPIGYAWTANLRDGLARVILYATGATALAFLLTAILWPLAHAGIVLPDPVSHWLTRVVYLSVGLGKLMLTVALIRDRRTRRAERGRLPRDTEERNP